MTFIVAVAGQLRVGLRPRGSEPAAPAPASASTSATCPSGHLCLYFNSDQQGARADLKQTDAAFNNELFDDGTAGRNGWTVQLGNKAASVWNRTGRYVHLYDGQYCTGERLTFPPGAKMGLGHLKNRVSSMRIDGESGYWASNDGHRECSTNVDQSRY